MAVKNLTLGYEEKVFEDLSFSLREGERLFIKGRNGTGKSTLVRTILSTSKSEKPRAKLLDGEISSNGDVRIGEYEQEIAQKYLDMTLEDAISQAYEEKNKAIDAQLVYKLLAQYLFDPKLDAKQKIRNLSGGQKARFQLIKMFVGDPNLLILDEPTNHLDLPSIEEIENSLEKFAGGILYISHDSYFIKKMGGDVVEL
jgi:ATPase subunit of ABC transporter with duplicated ATPase domains